MSSKKRKLIEAAEENEEEPIDNPQKKRKLMNYPSNTPSPKSNYSHKSKCSLCMKSSKIKQCGDCDYLYCAGCGDLKNENIVISSNMKIPCSICISREKKGIISCFDCSKSISRGKANECIDCRNYFCDHCDGSPCPDCYEYQCGDCTDMDECEQCGELLCNINGCFYEHQDICH